MDSQLQAISLSRLASVVYMLKELIENVEADSLIGMYPHITDTLMVVHYGLDEIALKIMEGKAK